MQITITKKSLQSASHKKKLVADICVAMHDFLINKKPIVISIDGDVELKNVAEALRNISEIIDSAASVTKDIGDEEDDPADWWKKEDEG